MTDWRFDASTGRYRDLDSGKFASEARIRSAIDKVADAAASRIADATARMRAGDLKLADWQREVMHVIKVSHVATGVVAHGGRAQMDQAAWGFIGRRIRTEYAYLRDFANAIEAGSLPIDGRLDARARLYGQAARVMFESMRARDDKARGFDQERNILHAAESCGECKSLSALGWVDLGTLVPIGSRTCRANCRCTITRRIAPESRGLLRLVS